MTRAAHPLQPCGNCPYRMDAPRRLWHRTEFEKLLVTEEDTLGAVFACHKQRDFAPRERGLCAGWLLDQKARGVPSIRLRLALSQDAGVLAAFEKVNAHGLALFSSVGAMCLANGVRKVRGKRGR